MKSVPPLPARTTSSSVPSPSKDVPWKESLGVLLAVLLGVAVLFSTCCLLRYGFKDKNVYDELVEYLDKTISISKINYNHELGLYEITESEMDALHHQRRYKYIIWAFFGADVVNFVFFVAAIMFYYSADTRFGTAHVLFWVILLLGAVYCVVEGAVFSGLLFPLSAKLPNETATLLDHAIPHNPGGINQMEYGIGCTFDYNLYNKFKRRLNPKNTCDHVIASSYIPRGLLITFLVMRVLALFVFAATMLLKPVGQAIAGVIARTRPEGGYKNRFAKNPNFKGNSVGIHTPKSTTFGVKDNRPSSANPPATPPVIIDHTISYNNAAFFATNGGLNSSRNSDVSRSDVGDVNINYKPSIHSSNSIVSEV